MEKPKFCKDCRWAVDEQYGPSAFHIVAHCGHPKYVKWDLVTGDKIHIRSRCSQVRKDESLCGFSARWFEPKESGFNHSSSETSGGTI